MRGDVIMGGLRQKVVAAGYHAKSDNRVGNADVCIEDESPIAVSRFQTENAGQVHCSKARISCTIAPKTNKNGR